MISITLFTLMIAAPLPATADTAPVAIPHFPDTVHAFVWRNWPLVDCERMAQVLDAQPEDVLRLGHAMGLEGPPPITSEVKDRAYITIIRRNWHLLPYEQLLELLGWTEEELAYTLREDDFLWIKLGSMKPACAPLKYTAPDEAAQAREKEIAQVLADSFEQTIGDETEELLFAFVDDLSSPPSETRPAPDSQFNPRYCSSYFTLYGDPLLDEDADAYPEGYLERLKQAGANGVWLQGVLYKLAPFPWDPSLSENYAQRLENLRALVARAKKHGIGVNMYLNEPRAMPLAFYDAHPDLKGVVEGDYAALCTSAPEVQAYITDAVASICEAVPDLAAFFTITASENLTNCWSHHNGGGCPRCSQRPAAEVIAEMNGLIKAGIDKAGAATHLIAWDWGWQDAWAVDAINALPQDVALMSVSEWSIPINRGGVDSMVGEYSISEVGPGPRATKHWAAARARGMKVLAKIQAGNTWELAAVPYVPALENVAQHAANLREANVDGLMLGWTLGGYPSPNLEVVAEMGRPGAAITPEEAMRAVADRRYGETAAPAVVKAWQQFSAAFREYPYHIGVVYSGPQQWGPANLLYDTPTGYAATMVGIPYDDLNRWRAVYPPEVFIAQFNKMADGFEAGLRTLRNELPNARSVSREQVDALWSEMRVAEAAALHFRGVANQSRMVMARDALIAAETRETAQPLIDELREVITSELDLARRLYAIQSHDTRIGFEATNQYWYIPIDLAEKAVNCRDLLDRWLPAQEARFGG